MELPIYCIVGDRPVKVVSTESGGSDVLAFDWETKQFQREMSYLTKVMMGDGEIDYVSVTEFDTYVKELQQQ